MVRPLPVAVFTSTRHYKRTSPPVRPSFNLAFGSERKGKVWSHIIIILHICFFFSFEFWFTFRPIQLCFCPDFNKHTHTQASRWAQQRRRSKARSLCNPKWLFTRASDSIVRTCLRVQVHVDHSRQIQVDCVLGTWNVLTFSPIQRVLCGILFAFSRSSSFCSLQAHIFRLNTLYLNLLRFLLGLAKRCALTRAIPSP